MSPNSITMKSRSPFYPGQPVPEEFFIGRRPQINKILTRGVGQVASGKPVAIFIQGEYGIGKSSFANYIRWIAERKYGLHGIYASLGGAETLDDLSQQVLEAALRSGACDPKRTERVRNWLAKYIGSQDLFGFSFNLSALKKDAPGLSTPFGMLGFLCEARKRLKDTGVKGICLILDEINGIAANKQFAHFIKGIVDSNAMEKEPLPLLLILCGVEERRREMIRGHEPVERIFDIIEIGTMSKDEMKTFFSHAFREGQMTVNDDAMDILTEYSAGFPKIMQMIGDAAYWSDREGVLDVDDAVEAVVIAADEIGKKYVEQQVVKALKSEDYKSILLKIAKIDPLSMSFTKSEVAAELTESEKRKFNNFIQKMKRLKAIRSGDMPGEYVFNHRMVRIYIWLDGLKNKEQK